MKKITGLLLTLLLAISLLGCSKEEAQFIEITSFDVDMSGYEGMPSTNHHFRGITPEEFMRVYEEDGSGIFYIGYKGVEKQPAQQEINKACKHRKQKRRAYVAVKEVV